MMIVLISFAGDALWCGDPAIEVLSLLPGGEGVTSSSRLTNFRQRLPGFGEAAVRLQAADC